MASLSSSLSRNPLSPAFPASSSSTHLSKVGLTSLKIRSRRGKLAQIEETHLRLAGYSRRNPNSKLETYKESVGLSDTLSNGKLEVQESDRSYDPFSPLKHRFMRFKREQFIENSVHFQNLAQGQAPKFLVIACADSRVCPSVILGFQPGEAFTVRNIANLVPPFESNHSETKAALEFSVNTLQVENILVVGHSCCGGIRALMSMQDEADSGGSFIKDWVVVGKNAKMRTKDAAGNLSFDHQCSYCEKESINHSMLRLLTYPWIEEKVKKGLLSIHGGYYDFVNCTFEKWTLDYRGKMDKEKGCPAKDHSVWC